MRRFLLLALGMGFLLPNTANAACYLKDGGGPVWHPPLHSIGFAPMKNYEKLISTLTTEEYNELKGTLAFDNLFPEGTVMPGKLSSASACMQLKMTSNRQEPLPCFCRR